jgi:8-oxo-dGTP diphosphatase
MLGRQFLVARMVAETRRRMAPRLGLSHPRIEGKYRSSILRPRQAAAAAILDERGRLLLVKENYDRRRYSLPGGAVDAGETPLETVVREAREETSVAIRVEHVIGVYRLVNGFTATLFACSIENGEPLRPETGEIDEVGWFDPDQIPQPTSNLLHHALADIVAGRHGVVRDGLPRIN